MLDDQLAYYQMLYKLEEYSLQHTQLYVPLEHCKFEV